MRNSENLDAFAKSLCAVQGELRPALKDSSNPFFKSKYADLESAVETARPILAKHGFAITQGCVERENGSWILVTKLMHSSGQWMETDCPILVKDQSAQGFGSGMSYARRYSFMAILGMTATDDDDDAEAAVGRHHQNLTPTKQPILKPNPPTPSPTPQPAPIPAQNGPIQANKTASSNLSEAQLKRLWAITKQYGWTTKQVKELVSYKFQKDSSSDLTKDEYDYLTQLLQSQKPENHEVIR